MFTLQHHNKDMNVTVFEGKKQKRIPQHFITN